MSIEIINAETGAIINVPTIEAAGAHITDAFAHVENSGVDGTTLWFLVTYVVS